MLARPTIAAVLGALVGGLLVGAVVVSGDDGRETGGRTAGSAGAFLAAWRRNLLGTWLVDVRFERRLIDGRHLSSTVRVVQRPPDRLRLAGAEISGRRAGADLACRRAADGTTRCRLPTPVVSYDEDVRGELARLRHLVSGPRALYRVGVGDRGCFVLRLRARVLAPPYGEDARLCFDPVTGALVRSEVRRAEGLDVQRAVRVRGSVSDADLRVPGSPGE